MRAVCMVVAWIGLTLGGCSGDTTDTASTHDSGTEAPQDLCEENPIPEIELSGLDCMSGLPSAWDRVLSAGRPCDVDEDCRLTNGYCDVSLTGLQQIAVNRCLEDSVISQYATAIAPCDTVQQTNCARLSIVGAECLFGTCTEIIDE